ncbi:MAG: hypothetical protein DI604_18560 [Delftia acidovorans]|nr:MAG: hypothetical protein DI604_18560 [Delftia acidovorans]
MSLIRIAARIAAVQALKGNTLVGDNVLDSEIGALGVSADGSLRSDEEKPFISVYTDAAKSEDNELRGFVPNGMTEFLFEAGITAAMTETDPSTDETTLIGIGIPGTDAAFEFHLDMVMRQIGDALTDPHNEWAEIFRSFHHGNMKIERARASQDGSGVRLAAQQMRVSVDLITDPPARVPLPQTHKLARFFAKAEELPELGPRLTLMKGALAGTQYSWKTSIQRYGMTYGEADSMLLTTLEGAEADVPIASVTGEAQI